MAHFDGMHGKRKLEQGTDDGEHSEACESDPESDNAPQTKKRRLDESDRASKDEKGPKWWEKTIKRLTNNKLIINEVDLNEVVDYEVDDNYARYVSFVEYSDDLQEYNSNDKRRMIIVGGFAQTEMNEIILQSNKNNDNSINNNNNNSNDNSSSSAAINSTNANNNGFQLVSFKSQYNKQNADLKKIGMDDGERLLTFMKFDTNNINSDTDFKIVVIDHKNGSYNCYDFENDKWLLHMIDKFTRDRLSAIPSSLLQCSRPIALIRTYYFGYLLEIISTVGAIVAAYFNSFPDAVVSVCWYIYITGAWYNTNEIRTYFVRSVDDIDMCHDTECQFYQIEVKRGKKRFQSNNLTQDKVCCFVV